MSERKGLRARKKRATHCRIVEVAVELFRTKGFDATSIDEIADRAVISRSTFFNYFSTKEALLSEIASGEMRTLAHLVANEWAEEKGPMRKIRRIMLLLISEQDPRLQVTRRVLLASMLHPEAIPEPIARMEAIISDLVEEAQASGQLRRDLPPERITRWTVGAYLAALTFHRWLAMDRGGEPISLAEVEQSVNMLFEGLAGPNYMTGV